MGEAKGSSDCNPDVQTHQILPGRIVPSRRKYVQSQNGLATVCQFDWAHRESRQIKYKAIFS